MKIAELSNLFVFTLLFLFRQVCEGGDGDMRSGNQTFVANANNSMSNFDNR